MGSLTNNYLSKLTIVTDTLSQNKT